MRYLIIALSLCVCLVTVGCGDKPQGTKPTGALEGTKPTGPAK